MASARGSAEWEWAFALQMGIHMQGGNFLSPSVQHEARRTGNSKWGQVLLCLPLPNSTGQGVPREGSSLHPLVPSSPSSAGRRCSAAQHLGTLSWGCPRFALKAAPGSDHGGDEGMCHLASF